MGVYQFLSKKLQKFTVVEFGMVKWIYLILGIFIASLYTPLLVLSVWVYVVLASLSAAPLMMFVFSFEGGLFNKAKQYLAHNNPSNQVLTLISCANIGIALAVLFPTLAGCEWWVYVAIIAALLIKPFSHVFLTK